MELGRQPESGGFFQQLGTHQEVGSLALAHIQGFLGGSHGCRQVPILAQPLR
jgi:hypothetical protein